MRFSRSTNEVFSATESSEAWRACFSRPAPITALRSTLIIRSFLRVLDHLTIATRWPKHSSDDFLVELESIGRDQRNSFEAHPFRQVSKQVQCVAVAALADDGRWPKPGPHLDHDEDPHRLLLAPDDRSDLVCLKFSSGEPSHFSITETTTPSGCSF